MTADVEHALLEAIYDRLDDDAPRAVYADWLTERGDLRGEFITLQLMPPALRTDKHARREALLLRRHRDAVVGPLGRVLTNIECARGLPVRGTLQLPDEATWHEVRAWRAWSTIEELDYPDPFRYSPEPWQDPVSPAMTSLKTVTFPNRSLVLAATQPWPFEELWLEVEREDYEALIAGPLLPRLRHLAVREAHRVYPDPSWLDNVRRCPPQITMIGVSLEDDVPRWIANARPTPLERLTLLSYGGGGGVAVQLSRDPTGELTRLDLELRYVGKLQQWDVDHAAQRISELPAGTLTHLTARAVLGYRTQYAERVPIGAQIIPLPEIVAAGAAILR